MGDDGGRIGGEQCSQIEILDYIHAKDGNGKVVYGIEAFVWLRKACAINSGRFLRSSQL